MSQSRLGGLLAKCSQQRQGLFSRPGGQVSSAPVPLLPALLIMTPGAHPSPARSRIQGYRQEPWLPLI